MQTSLTAPTVTEVLCIVCIVFSYSISYNNNSNIDIYTVATRENYATIHEQVQTVGAYRFLKTKPYMNRYNHT